MVSIFYIYTINTSIAVSHIIKPVSNNVNIVQGYK